MTLQRYGIRTPLVKGFTKFFRNFFRFFFEGENVCRETPSHMAKAERVSVGQSVGQLFEIGYKGYNKKLSSNNYIYNYYYLNILFPISRQFYLTD